MTYCNSIPKDLLLVIVVNQKREREDGMYLGTREKVNQDSVQGQVMDKEVDQL